MRPTAAVITNIAPVHLETAGSLAQIARNKAELLDLARPRRPVRGAGPGPRARARTCARTCASIRHGPGGDVSLRALRQTRSPRSNASGGRRRSPRRCRSAHNLDNLVAAVALLVGLGLPVPSEVDARLPPLRWQTVRLGELELVLDCFNSSPDALIAALEAFAGEPASRRLAVLGTFAELGAATRRHHRSAGAAAAAWASTS